MKRSFCAVTQRQPQCFVALFFAEWLILNAQQSRGPGGQVAEKHIGLQRRAGLEVKDVIFLGKRFDPIRFLDRGQYSSIERLECSVGRLYHQSRDVGIGETAGELGQFRQRQAKGQQQGDTDGGEIEDRRLDQFRCRVAATGQRQFHRSEPKAQRRRFISDGRRRARPARQGDEFAFSGAAGRRVRDRPRHPSRKRRRYAGGPISGSVASGVMVIE